VDGYSLYEYVKGNPLNAVDPYGTTTKGICKCCCPDSVAFENVNWVAVKKNKYIEIKPLPESLPAVVGHQFDIKFKWTWEDTKDPVKKSDRPCTVKWEEDPGDNPYKLSGHKWTDGYNDLTGTNRYKHMFKRHNLDSKLKNIKETEGKMIDRPILPLTNKKPNRILKIKVTFSASEKCIELNACKKNKNTVIKVGTQVLKRKKVGKKYETTRATFS